MKKIFAITVIAFILNFIWEISQAFLYAPHYVGIGGLVRVHLQASLGDVLLFLVILMLDALVFGRDYVQKIDSKRLTMMMSIGFALAVAVEKYALFSGRWVYNFLMPIIPGLNVGLVPVLQMMLIPVCVFFIFKRLKI